MHEINRILTRSNFSTEIRKLHDPAAEYMELAHCVRTQAQIKLLRDCISINLIPVQLKKHTI